MSDSGADAGQTKGAGASSEFTEREMQMLAWAMQSLKSGPPELDYEKLAAFAGMSNPRSASNAWAKIRNKLNLTTGDGSATPSKKSPQKKKKPAPVQTGDADDDEAETPKKSPRKRTPKKQDVDGEASPKKRGRPAAKGKKAPADQSANVKNESNGDGDGGDDVKMEESDDLKPDSKAKDDAAVVQEEI